VINAWGSVTIYGGSLMPPEVVQAMVEAAANYVPLVTLQQRAGERIAELAGVEAALVSAGAAGGITLAVAGCLTGADPARIQLLPDASSMPNEVIVLTGGRPNYMYQAAEAGGARLVHVGTAERLAADDVAAAIGPRTAAVLLVVAMLDRLPGRAPEVTTTLAEVAAVTRPAGVPLLVDAAAELPPTANLRAFLAAGADVVIFSGGKGLRGPQASGLVLGRRDLIAAAAANNNPHSAVGRPQKVGKEEIAGLVRAVELFVARDEAAEQRQWTAMAEHVAAALQGLPGVRATVERSGTYARPPITPVCVARLDEAAGLTPAAVREQLLAGEPSIAVGGNADSLVVNPLPLTPGQEAIVAERLRAVLARSEQGAPAARR
jgi:L-seryl-tRNA(Ser) seleniumtransferase